MSITQEQILITGAGGQLGQALYKLLPQAHALDHSELDITEEQDVINCVHDLGIKTIINAAAYTKVDLAEDSEQQDLCKALNHTAVRSLANTQCQLIHVSTDYVFDGLNHRPYTEDDQACPINVYGRSKCLGEYEALRKYPHNIVVRTSWLYSEIGSNFFLTMLRLGKSRDSINVVADQVGTPTYAGDLAQALVNIVDAISIATPTHPHSKGGIYHYSNEGVASWYDFACAIMKEANLPCAVSPIKAEEYPTKAQRPYYSVLDKSKIKTTFNMSIPHWQESLRKCLKQTQQS